MYRIIVIILVYTFHLPQSKLIFYLKISFIFFHFIKIKNIIKNPLILNCQKVPPKKQESMLPHVHKKVGSYSQTFTSLHESHRPPQQTELNFWLSRLRTVPKSLSMAPTCVRGFEKARCRFNTTGFEFEICSCFISRPSQVSGK